MESLCDVNLKFLFSCLLQLRKRCLRFEKMKNTGYFVYG